jgi:ribosomal protein S18 acetylase RimI-like enzyme
MSFSPLEQSPLEKIRHIETLAMRAWPAEEVIVQAGWRLRHTRGVTRRANSVWPNGAGREDEGATLALRLEAVEAFYQARNLPPRFQICPVAVPADLDHQLAARGYRAVAPTHVQRAFLKTVLMQTDTAHAGSGWDLRIGEAPSDAWFAAYQRAEASGDHEAAMRRTIIAQISADGRARCGFALLCLAGEPIALGLGVVEAGYLGIFSMATVSAARRQGAATLILRGLADWAYAQGATQAYLQVMHNNQAAQALYAQVGFETLYDYHYREREIVRFSIDPLRDRTYTY